MKLLPPLREEKNWKNKTGRNKKYMKEITLNDVMNKTLKLEQTTAGLQQITEGLQQTTADLEKTTAGLQQTTAELQQTTAKLEQTTMKLEQTTNNIMEYLVTMKSQLDTRIDTLDQKFETKLNAMDQKFERKFDILFDAIGDINEKFTVVDYKFIQLKRQVLAS